MVDQRAIEDAAKALAASKHAIALTGAGISVPSGIPDFRSEAGLWTKFDITEYGTISAFRADPLKVWKLFKAIGEMVDGAQPNPAHVALARLEELGVIHTVITQNIDVLHQRGGSTRVIEFHGSGATLTCLACRKWFTHDDARGLKDEEGVPYCPCGAVLKPDVVLFGESIPDDSLRQAFREAERADLVLSAGTSATVAPASMIPAVVTSHGGKIVEMDLIRTALSDMAEHRVCGDLSVTLPKLAEAVEDLL